MTFNYSNYFPLVFLAILSYILIVIVCERGYFRWIKKYWFYVRSPFNKFSTFFYLLAFSLFFISLLDLRGEEKKYKTVIQDQKTIIILDTSLSMLVEDVRPNRFQKAIIIARHFIKKAIGHQVAVVLFSDTQRRLIPFTSDFDLLDARVSGLNEMDIAKGGSNIYQALLESLQYFRESSHSDTDTLQGNILLITDLEDNGDFLDLKIPDGISLAIVGVGTEKGGPIPLRNKGGGFVGHKTYNGEKVISKLNKGLFDRISSRVRNFKYWIVLSYNMPTEEVVDFFRNFYKGKIKQGDARIKPVLGYRLIIIGIISLIISIFLSMRKSFVSVCLLLSISQSFAYNREDILEKFRNGKLDRDQRLKLAETFLEEGEDEEALILYKENISDLSREDVKVLFNFGTALLKNEEIKEGLFVFQKLEEKLKYASNEENKKVFSDMRENVLLALRQKSFRDRIREERSGRGEGKHTLRKILNPNSKLESNPEPNSSLEQKERKLVEQRKKIKIPAFLKQLLSDDRSLQTKYLDSSMKKKNRQSISKDW